MSAWLAKVLMGILFAYIGLVIFVFFIQERLLFFPDPTALEKAPELRQLGFASQEFPSPSGKLRYYIRKDPEAQVTLLVFHGNAGRAADRAYLIRGLLDLNLNLVLAEYPGYAGNQEKPGEKSLIDNAIALFDHLDKNLNTSVFAMGESLGTGVAIGLAHQRPVKGLVLLSPYPSISRVAQYHYPYLPVSLLIRHPFPAHEWIGRLSDIPILAFHGKMDEVIPYSLGEQLWQSLPARDQANKKWVPVPQSLHNDLVDYLGPRLHEEIKAHFSWQ